MGESQGLLLVAWDGDALEIQVRSHGDAPGGVVRRRNVLRGQKLHDLGLQQLPTC